MKDNEKKLYTLEDIAEMFNNCSGFFRTSNGEVSINVENSRLVSLSLNFDFSKELGGTNNG